MFFWGEVLLFKTHHGAKWDCSGSVVVDSDEVDEEGRPTHHGWDQERPNEHLLNPSSAYNIQSKFIINDINRSVSCIYPRKLSRRQWEGCGSFFSILPPCFAYKLPPK